MLQNFLALRLKEIQSDSPVLPLNLIELRNGDHIQDWKLACAGSFYMSAWLGCDVQIFVRTLV